MPRTPTMWMRGDNKCYYVTINKRRIKLGHNKEQAERRFHALLANPEELANEISNPLLSDVVVRFIAWNRKHQRKGTANWYDYYLSRFVAKHPTLRAKDVRVFHVQGWMDDSSNGNGDKVSKARTLKRCLKWAAEQQLITANPIANLKIPRATPQHVCIDGAAFAELKTWVKTKEFLDLITAAHHSGARPQELRIIEARHYEKENRRWLLPWPALLKLAQLL